MHGLEHDRNHWYGFERAKIRDNGMLVTGMLFGVTHLYWKTSSAKGVGDPMGTALLAANLAQNSDCDHCLGALLPVSRAKANSMIPGRYRRERTLML